MSSYFQYVSSKLKVVYKNSKLGSKLEIFGTVSHFSLNNLYLHLWLHGHVNLLERAEHSNCQVSGFDKINLHPGFKDTMFLAQLVLEVDHNEALNK